MDSSCWMCRKDPLPQGQGMARFGLCRYHLLARVAELMAQKGEPAIEVLRG